MSERVPEKLVRVEYEIPPLRAIYDTYFEDMDVQPDQVYRDALMEIQPRAHIRKVERGVTPAPDKGDYA